MRTALLNRRKELNLTQAKVAELVGINRASYVHIERGTRNPSLDVAIRIANVLGCKMDDIFLVTDVSDGHTKLTGTDN